MANQNIGHVQCPFTGKAAAVRADCRGKLYYYSEAGKITPNLPQGQRWLERSMVRWPMPDQPPSGVEVREIVRGAPPIIEINRAAAEPLTPTAETVTSEKPLTGVTAKKRAGIWDFLEGETNV